LSEPSAVFDAGSLSELYRYRVDYDPGFFPKLGREAGITRASDVLDVCCGGGQLARGIAPFARSVIGVDESARMLSAAPSAANITYIRHDINAPALPEAIAGRRFDQFLLGRAIQWVEAGRFGQILEANLAPGGRVVICGAGWDVTTAWAERFYRLRQTYSRNPVVTDPQGRQKMARLGFRLTGRMSAVAPWEGDLDYLLRHALSYSNSAAGILADLENFQAALEATLAPFLDGGVIRGHTNSWAEIHVRVTAG
jgi:SAM-dependent methyltransferase